MSQVGLVAITFNGLGHRVGRLVKQFARAPDATHADQSWLYRLFLLFAKICMGKRSNLNSRSQPQTPKPYAGCGKSWRIGIISVLALLSILSKPTDVFTEYCKILFCYGSRLSQFYQGNKLKLKF